MNSFDKFISRLAFILYFVQVIKRAQQNGFVLNHSSLLRIELETQIESQNGVVKLSPNCRTWNVFYINLLQKINYIVYCYGISILITMPTHFSWQYLTGR